MASSLVIYANGFCKLNCFIFSDRDEDGKPCFSSIAKGGCFLDKELEASGFTRKDKGIKKTSRRYGLACFFLNLHLHGERERCYMAKWMRLPTR